MMEIVADEWLANIFGCPVFRISTNGQTLPPIACLAQLIKDRVTGAGEAFCYAKSIPVMLARPGWLARVYMWSTLTSPLLLPGANVAALSPECWFREIQPVDYGPHWQLPVRAFVTPIPFRSAGLIVDR